MNYAIINANLLNGTRDMEVQPDRTVLVDGNKIIKIGKDVRIPDGYKVYNLSHKYLLPGLINMHVHLFGTGKPSKNISGGPTQKYVIKFIKTPVGHVVLDQIVKRDALMALHSGTTTLRCVGDFEYADVKLRDKIRRGELVGPRMIVSGPALTVTNGHGDGTFAVVCDTVEAVHEQVRKNLEHGVDFIKICNTGGVMDSTEKGHAGILRMPGEITKAIVEDAHKAGVIVASHTESTEGVRQALEAGVDSIEHGAPMDEEIMKLYKEKGSFVTCTISPALPIAKLDKELTKMTDVHLYNGDMVARGIIESARQGVENGIPVALGTDAACPFAMQYNMWRELAYFKENVGVDNRFALYSATLNNARLLKMDDKIGSIEEGKLADMIVTDENPLENLRTLSNVRMVFVDGNVIEQPNVRKFDNIETELDKLISA